MKRIVSLFLALTLLVGCGTSNKNSEATFSGSAKGYHGDIKLDVTVDDSSIVSIVVTEESETEGIGKVALPILVQDAVDNQTYNVDVVSGATVTSDAFKLALQEALTNGKVDLEKFATKNSSGAKEEIAESYDLVVVGSGVAGLSSALVAAQKGMNVVVLEKMAILGGASAMAGSGTLATGSQWHKEDGVDDTIEKLKADLLANGHNKNDEATLDLYMNNIAASFDWLVSADGANVAYKREKPGRNYSGEGGGSGVIKSLTTSLEEKGVKILTNTKATELIVEDGSVVGVKANSSSADYTLSAKSVILATGGFGNNDSLVPTEYKNYVYAGAPGADGDALTMVKDLNANLINMEYVNVQPNSIVMPSGLGQYTNPGVAKAYATSGAFLVNQEGVRFANEQGSTWDLIQAMKENDKTYLILDKDAFNAFNEGMMGSKIYSESDVETWLANDGSSNPFMIQADSLEKLAEKLEISPEALQKTADTYNQEAKAGSDGMGRANTVEIKEENGVYAVQMWLRYYATLGGLQVNDNFQVMNQDGQAITGLYACGEVVGGALGDLYYPGSLFGWSMTSGYGAGNSVAK